MNKPYTNKQTNKQINKYTIFHFIFKLDIKNEISFLHLFSEIDRPPLILIFLFIYLNLNEIKTNTINEIKLSIT